MAKAWYEAAFGADYLERYAHRDQEEAARTVETFFQLMEAKPGRQVLDLCCGAGRHVIAMRAAGHRVIGLDLSLDLLGAGQEVFRRETGCFRENSDGVECPLFVRGDKRRLPLKDSAFDVVTHFFTAFGYFERDADNFGVFHQVRRVLRPGGWYLFDFLSAPAVLREFEAEDRIESHEDFADGTRVETLKRLSEDNRRVEKRMRFLFDGDVQKELVESVRLFTPEELRAALVEAGFVVRHEWGDYHAGRYDERRSKRWIVLGKNSIK